MKVSLNERLKEEYKGTVQTLNCFRDGHLRWSKKIYVPDTEVKDCYAQFNHKSKGVFLYTLTDLKAVKRWNKNIPKWNEF